MRLTDEDRKVLRTLGIVLSGAVLLASYAVRDQVSDGLAAATRISFPLAIYIFARLWMAEGRARERAEMERQRPKE